MYAVSMTMIIKKEKLAENTLFNISQPLALQPGTELKWKQKRSERLRWIFFNNFDQNILSDFPIEIVFH